MEQKNTNYTAITLKIPNEDLAVLRLLKDKKIANGTLIKMLVKTTDENELALLRVMREVIKEAGGN